ncbi:hypothetical protein DFH06DRAFT_525517 [Mycena polygramma]|nr:hypothetical protein DFH06DRAFT_525517 [Mycena polygramma]
MSLRPVSRLRIGAHIRCAHKRAGTPLPYNSAGTPFDLGSLSLPAAEWQNFGSSSKAPNPPHPDSAHYTALFDAFSKRAYRTHESAPDPAPIALNRRVYFSPRAVYAEMRSVPDAFSPVAEVVLLTTSLRTFVTTEDYAAARVALRAFREISWLRMRRVQRTNVRDAILGALALRVHFASEHARQVIAARLLLVELSLFYPESNKGEHDSADQVEDVNALAFILHRAHVFAWERVHGWSTPRLRDEEQKATREMEGPRRRNRPFS